MIEDTSGQDRVLSPKRRWRFPVIGGLVGLAVAIVLLASIPALRRIGNVEHAIEANRLSYATVVRGDLVRELGVEGRIVASSYPTLYSPVRGTITLLVRAGERVERDQLVAEIDSPELANRLKQESSQVEVLEADLARQRISAKTGRMAAQQAIELKKLELESAKRALDRATRTFAEGLINAADYEAAEDAVKIGALEHKNLVGKAILDEEVMDFETRNRELQLKRQKLIVEDLNRQVEDLRIKSPVIGVVGTLSVDPKDLVNTNQPIMTVIDLSAFEIEVSIPESYADDIRAGTRVEILYENQNYQGMVASVAPEVNNSTVSGTVVFNDDRPSGLKQNQRVSTRMILSSKEDTLKVRRGPFLEGGGGRKVFAVVDNMAYLKTITVGITSLSEVEILSGLEEGERIVISDLSQVGDAETVLLRK